jgi:hypothetical protein
MEPPREKSHAVPTTHQVTELAMQTVLRTLPAQAYRRIFEMRALLKHGATCTMRATGGCHKCRRYWALLRTHARQCRQTEGAPAGRCCRYRACPVPRCRDLKEHLRRLQRQRAE